MRVGWAACALWVGFFAYYFQYTDDLSFNGGPDEEPHYHAARFIDEHGRLAVYPDDEDKLYFSGHGTTRSFRPPLAYLAGVGVAKLFDVLGMEEKVRYRGASSLFGALTVAGLFLVLTVVSGMPVLALFCAASFGLLPQFTFLSAYFNDDVAAVFSTTCLLLSLVLMLKRGVDAPTLLLAGGSTGLVIISKPSAWSVAAGLLLLLPWLVTRSRVRLTRAALIFGLAAVIVGGWWIALNLYTHGWHDPLNWAVERALGEKHRTLPDGVGVGYAAQGIGWRQLLANHDGFLTDTYTSAVGNLDWLRLPMGPLQYGFYALLLLAAATGAVWGWLSPDRHPTVPRSALVVLLFSLALQVAAYLWVNLYRDSQAQGRYLLPAAPVVMAFVVVALGRLVDAYRLRGYCDRRWFHTASLALAVGALLVPVYVHLHGLVHYVLPFYRLADYHGVKTVDFTPLTGVWDTETARTHQLQVRGLRGRAVRIESSGADPWILLPHDYTRFFENRVLLRVTLESPANGTFAVYWDAGSGMSESTSARRHFNIGHQVLYLRLDTDDLRAVRIDPLAGPGGLVVYEIAVAPIVHAPMTVLGFLIGWLDERVTGTGGERQRATAVPTG